MTAVPKGVFVNYLSHCLVAIFHPLPANYWNFKRLCCTFSKIQRLFYLPKLS